MRAAMAFYGPDGGASIVEGPTGLGHLLLQIDPEDAFDDQPVRCQRGWVVSAARLDNREELLNAFHLPTPDATKLSDGHLVGLAFDQWGEDISRHLQGDWALAAFDARERRLLLARDAYGTTALYFHQGNGFVAFASSLKALLALPAIAKEPDPMRLAQVLVSWEQDAELTAYKGFRRLVHAHALTVEARGQYRISRYWSPEGREPLSWRNDQEYEEAFLEHYTRAVRCCLRSRKPIAAMLSGGRDSGSIIALSAPILAAQSRELIAYTSVPNFPPGGAEKNRLGNEWDQAHAAALMAGTNVRHTAVDAADYGVLQGIERLLHIHDGPSHAAANHFWIQAIAEIAASNGAKVLLTGQMGNGTVSWTGNGSALLAIRQGKPHIAWRLFLHAEPNLWLTLKRQILKPVLMPVLRMRKRILSPGGTPWRAYSALNMNMALALDLDGRMHAAGHDTTFTISPLQDHRLFFFGPDRSVAAALFSEMGPMHSLSVRDPTTNLALIEFLLRVPDDQFRRQGQPSSLFRRSLRSRLPEAVLAGRLKGLQAADVGYRILRELPEIRQKLDDLEAHPVAREFLDLPLMRKSLQELVGEVSPNTTTKAGKILLRGLGVGLFLLHID
jgi:asparagine synthase (glutamine-hydrolysing)